MAFTNHPIANILLLATLLFAIYSMWIGSELNGYKGALRHLRDHGPHLLPGSTIPLLQNYTGISQVDYFLTVLQCVFANATDGSAPHLSLFAFYFIGQLTAVISVMAVESHRSVSRGKTVSWFVLWGMAIQCLGFGIIMPIYACLHLSTRPSSPLPKSTFGHGLQNLPQVITLGLLLPTLLAGLPLDPIPHQRLVAAWQFFPIYISLLTFLSSLIAKPPGTITETKSQLSHIYHFGQSIGRWTHGFTISLLVFLYISPSSLPFPTSFTSPLTFSNVFLPPSPLTFPPSKVNLIDGATAFFQYDFLNGFIAVMIWQVSMSTSSKAMIGYGELIWDVLSKGPGYAVCRISEVRDLRLFENVQVEGKKGK